MEKIRLSFLCVIIGVSSALSSDISENEPFIFTGYKITNVNSSTFSSINPSINHLILKDNVFGTIESNSFEDFYRLESLEIEGNELLNLQPGTFEGVNSLEKLWIKNETKLMILHPDSFKGLKNLKHLYLIEIHVQHLDAGFFNELKNLQSLHLSRNNFVNFQPGFFEGLNGLEKLYIRNEIGMTTINRDSFKELGNLKHLNLIDNNIENLNHGAFNGLENLQSLNIYGNNLNDLRPGIFRELKKLHELNINNKKNMTTLHKGSLHGLESLTRINLSRNGLIDLEPGAFDGLRRLEFSKKSTRRYEEKIRENLYSKLFPFTNLSFAFRDIPFAFLERDEVFSGTIRKIKNYFDVHLDGNEITIIKNRTFDGAFITELDLHNNKIAKIIPGAFSGLTVWNLNMSDNQLTIIEPETFNGILDIRGLDLSKNKLTCLTHGSFNGLIDFTNFDFVLHLENNLITTIEDFTFNGFVFQLLDLHSNQIGVEGFGNFTGSSIKQLDFSENKINVTSEWLLDRIPGVEILVLSNQKKNMERQEIRIWESRKKLLGSEGLPNQTPDAAMMIHGFETRTKSNFLEIVRTKMEDYVKITSTDVPSTSFVSSNASQLSQFEYLLHFLSLLIFYKLYL